MKLSTIYFACLGGSTAQAQYNKFPPFPGSVASWGEERLDLFLKDDNGYVYHKYHANAKEGWHKEYEFMNFTVDSDSVPIAVTWAKDRLDVFANSGGWLVHKFWDGSQWLPPTADPEELAVGFYGTVAVTSWSEGRFDIIGRNDSDEGYWHKYYDGSSWQPAELNANSLGTDGFDTEFFASDPTAVSWGKNRLDIFGILTNGTALHKYWDGSAWKPSATGWEQFGDKLSYSIPQSIRATSRGKNQFDVWALRQVTQGMGTLVHRYWDGNQLSDWEDMGGLYHSVPAVNHWSKNRIDVFGGFQPLLPGTGRVFYKYWDGYQWNPAINPPDDQPTWLDHGPKGDGLSKDIASCSWTANNLNVFSIDNKGKLRWQLWEGSQWLPAVDDWYDLGQVESSNEVNAYVLRLQDQARIARGNRGEMESKIGSRFVVQGGREHLGL